MTTNHDNPIPAEHKFRVRVDGVSLPERFATKAEAFAFAREQGHTWFFVSDGVFCVDEFEDHDPNALEAAVRGEWNNAD